MDIISWIEHQKTTDIICLQEVPIVHINQFYRSLPRDVWGHRYTKSFIFRKKIYGIVTLFRQKKLRLVRTKTLLLGVHPMEKSFLGNPMEKRCLFTTFRIGTKTVTVANAHLVVMATNRSRYKQIHHIAHYLISSPYAAVIMGDFNIHNMRINKKLITFMKKYGFHTPLEKLTTHRLGIIKHQLDYVFVSKCKILKLEAPRVRISDHYPVIASIQL
jgi:endonuclease/exonuclease/phosphatase family metal-dependent hydrolase